MIEDESIDEIERFLDSISWRYDSVIVLATKHDPKEETTWAHVRNRGNFYAQIGQIKDWVLKQDERARRQDIECTDKEDKKDGSD